MPGRAPRRVIHRVTPGSTVTKDVPRGALALTRVKQVNVEGWADRFREAVARRKKPGDEH